MKNLRHDIIFAHCPRLGELTDDAAALAAGLWEPGAGVALPHTGTARVQEVGTSGEVQRINRRPAHQGLPLRQQSHPQRVRSLNI